MSVQKIDYSGKEILCIDYKDVKSQDEMMSVLKESFEAVANSSNVLLYSDLTGASLGPDFMKEVKEGSKKLVGNVDKAAVIGVTGLKKILMKSYNMFVASDRETKVFDTKQEALDYLVS